MIALLLCGCAGEDDPSESDAVDTDVLAESDDPCDAYTWDTVGGPFMLSWCAGCHGSGVQGAARSGAPEGVDLNTYDGALQWLGRIEARATGDSPDMPPASMPPTADIEALETWLACEAG